MWDIWCIGNGIVYRDRKYKFIDIYFLFSLTIQHIAVSSIENEQRRVKVPFTINDN